MSVLTPARRQAIADSLGREPESVVEIDDGYDYVVAIVDDAWVYRFPRRRYVEEVLEREIALLPLLMEALPVPVPWFERVVREPVFFVAYRLIDGEPLVDEDPEAVAAFLAALHGLERAAPLLERPPWRDEYVERCERFARDVLPLLDADVRPRARALLAEAATLTGFDAVPIHGDVLAEHLRCRDSRLVGVIDWGDARVGDPALDYAWLLNGPFPHWDVDDELRRRARFYHRLEPWVWAHYGLVTAKPGHVRTGLAEIDSRL
jgi:aminoglycoside phosphotransferase (APT) family kinase protein